MRGIGVGWTILFRLTVFSRSLIGSSTYGIAYKVVLCRYCHAAHLNLLHVKQEVDVRLIFPAGWVGVEQCGRGWAGWTVMGQGGRGWAHHS